jgi:hypothetical protein
MDNLEWIDGFGLAYIDFAAQKPYPEAERRVVPRSCRAQRRRVGAIGAMPRALQGSPK